MCLFGIAEKRRGDAAKYVVNNADFSSLFIGWRLVVILTTNLHIFIFAITASIVSDFSSYTREYDNHCITVP
jgi:hypothetical protein